MGVLEFRGRFRGRELDLEEVDAGNESLEAVVRDLDGRDSSVGFYKGRA